MINLKPVFNKILVIVLSIFSFYYTNKIVELLKEQDPLMKEIKSTEEKYTLAAVDAQIENNTIRSGKKGKTIDYEKTYHQMKNYGTYNESLTILKETIPVISIENNYDKYVIGGNPTNKNIALVFLLKEDTKPGNIIKILNQEKVTGTFFIDGTYLEKNVTLIKNTKKHEFELLSYQGKYNESYFKTSLSYLESLTQKNPKYCYVEEENAEFLKLCERLKLHTIKPTLIIKNSLYQKVKENLANSSIISIEINSFNEKELSTTIEYIKAKGYGLISLDYLISE